MPQLEKDYSEVLSKNIKRYLHNYKMTQLDLARALDVSTSTVSDWINKKKEPRIKKIDAMCRLFDCRRSDIMSDITPDIDSPLVKIPILGNMPAGIPISAKDEILGYEEIPVEMSKQGSFFAIRIKGDSMAPRILHGDTVIVRQQSDVVSGDIAIVRINGDDATCKRVLKQDDSITLVPFNPSYAPQTYSKKDISNLPVVVIGKVVELRARF